MSSHLSSVRSRLEVNEESNNEWMRMRRRSASCLAGDVLDQKPGWPLLRRLTSAADPGTREMSVVQWAMALPDRSWAEKRQDTEISETGTRFESLLKSCTCKWLSYELLQTATSNFHSANLIGKGGCNNVYKGTLEDGKQVAVKIRKSSSPEAKEDFVKEVEIMSSLKNKNITPLVGICIKDSSLISVYHFLNQGSLEGKNKERSPLTWDLRFSIAVKVAEALNYLHNDASRPVIHRDVKSANILLSDGLEPQLSDFGMAMWAPTASAFVTQPDVVGTFGYLAPEYFMYGKVSDKIDVYAFGVVLLELISGREPIITSKDSKAQQSLVMWVSK
ncbi:Protein kinase STUNTED [Linum perenne]